MVVEYSSSSNTPSAVVRCAVQKLPPNEACEVRLRFFPYRLTGSENYSPARLSIAYNTN